MPIKLFALSKWLVDAFVLHKAKLLVSKWLGSVLPNTWTYTFEVLCFSVQLKAA